MTQKDETLSEKLDLYQVFNFAKEEKDAFVLADLLFGSAALWLPLLLGLMYQSKTTMWRELVKLLDSGAGYTFALAYLAAGGSYLYLDRMKKTVNVMRDEASPNVFRSFVILVVFGLACTIAHFSNLIFTESSTLALNVLEIAYLIVSIFFGIRLFCLKNIDKLPGKLEMFQARETARARAIADAAKSENEY